VIEVNPVGIPGKLEIHSASEQGQVEINTEIWTNYEAIAAVLPKPANSYSRVDLMKLASDAFSENDHQLISEIFIKTMMWGSGTTNGRGPRYTSKALSDGKLVATLIKAREFLIKSDIPSAYDLHRQIPGVGPSFHTKLLWVIGSDIERLDPRPLVLDELVWKGLGAIGWSSVRAAKTLRRGRRYLAYLDFCERLASESEWTPEDIEYSLYQLGKKR
jgi:hypothetical protein